MNKLAYKTEDGYRNVYINNQLSKQFNIRGNDNAYNDAREYGFKYLNSVTYPVVNKEDEYKALILPKSSVIIVDEDGVSVGTIDTGRRFSNHANLRGLSDPLVSFRPEVKEFKDYLTYNLDISFTDWIENV